MLAPSSNNNQPATRQDAVQDHVSRTEVLAPRALGTDYESLRIIEERIIKYIHHVKANRRETPPLTPENHDRKRRRLKHQIKNLQIQLRELDAAQRAEYDYKSARRFLDLIMKKRLGEEVDDEEFQRLKGFLEEKAEFDPNHNMDDQRTE